MKILNKMKSALRNKSIKEISLMDIFRNKFSKKPRRLRKRKE